MKKSVLTMFTICAALLWSQAGCSVIDTGPKMFSEIMGGVKATAVPLIQKFQPEEMTTGANGAVNDPEFIVEGYIGSGVIYKMTLRAIGANAAFDIDAAGTGTREYSAEEIEVLRQLWNDPNLNDEQKYSILRSILERLLAGDPVATAASPEVVTDATTDGG